MHHLMRSVFVATCFCLFGGSNTHAAIVTIQGIADPDTAYYERGSDAFFRMDLVDPPPRETQQRFHSIADPSVTFGSLAFDGFPNDERFRFGTLTYDDSSVIGGNGMAQITDVNLGITADPLNPSYINFGRWTDVVTTIDAFSGTISFIGGAVSSIDLTTTGSLFIPTTGVEATGGFNISGDRFDGNFVSTVGFGSPVEYDLQGTITAIPEPSSIALLGVLGCVSMMRSRRKQ